MRFAQHPTPNPSPEGREVASSQTGAYVAGATGGMSPPGASTSVLSGMCPPA